ncbi:hypothetical protein [Nannocystis pusilla]|uniref:hypothetical protein n=1 Tax=Nannocystis pusilla TaxID=889268 RepID=UPI003B7FC1CC
MHPLRRLSFVLSCVSSVGLAACGSDPDVGETATTTAATDDTGETGTTPAATAEVTSEPTDSDPGTATTEGGDTSTTSSVPTTGNDLTTGVDTTTMGVDTTTMGVDTTTTMGVDTTTTMGVDTTTTMGVDTTTGDDTTTTGVDTTTGDDSTSTGADDPWDCEGGEPVTVNAIGKYSTLAAAIAAAPNDATITVCAGTYHEAVVIDRPMTLLGAGQDKTFLDGSGAETPIFIDSVSVTIEGFTFQHGEAEHNPLGNSVCGGALAIDDAAVPMTVTVKDCTFTDNHSENTAAPSATTAAATTTSRSWSSRASRSPATAPT